MPHILGWFGLVVPFYRIMRDNIIYVMLYNKSNGQSCCLSNFSLFFSPLLLYVQYKGNFILYGYVNNVVNFVSSLFWIYSVFELVLLPFVWCGLVEMARFYQNVQCSQQNSELFLLSRTKENFPPPWLFVNQIIETTWQNSQDS